MGLVGAIDFNYACYFGLLGLWLGFHWLGVGWAKVDGLKGRMGLILGFVAWWLFPLVCFKEILRGILSSLFKVYY